jgi:hypothetical protein
MRYQLPRAFEIQVSRQIFSLSQVICQQNEKGEDRGGWEDTYDEKTSL